MILKKSFLTVVLVAVLAIFSFFACSGEENDISEKKKLTFKTELGYEFEVGFIHKGEFYSVQEDQVLRFLQSQNKEKADFTDLSIEIDTKSGRGTMSSHASLMNNNVSLISVSMDLNLDEDGKRLIISGSTCQCISPDYAEDCVANSLTGGCECSDCPENCQKSSSVVSSEGLFQFFV